MPRRLYAIIIEHSRDHPHRAGEILECTICSARRVHSGAYYVGIIQVILLAMATAVCIIWAVFGMWSMIFAAYAFTFKLISIGKRVIVDHNMMLAYGEMGNKVVSGYRYNWDKIR